MSDVSAVKKVQNRNAYWSFWGGLLSFFCLGPFLGIPAIIVGTKAKREMRESPDEFSNASQAQLGVIFGWITTGIFIIGLLITAVTFAGRS